MVGRRSALMWQWLEEQGYTQGDGKLLEQGKKAWKKKYNREYQRQRRKETAYHIVPYSPDENEEMLGYAKTAHKASTTYIRESSLAHGRGQYLIPENYQAQIITLREELALIRYNLESIRTLAIRAYGADKAKQFDLAIDRTYYLDQFIREALAQPLVPKST